MKIEKVKKDSKKLNLKLQISKLKKKSTLPNDEIINPNNTKPKKSLGRLILGIILSLGIIFISLLTIFLLYIVIRAPKFDTDLLYKSGSNNTDYWQRVAGKAKSLREGGKLIKIMPPLEGKAKDDEEPEDRNLSIDAAWNVKPCNNMVDFQDDIDYDYYVSEVMKLLILN